MNQDRWRQIERVCHAALARAPSERAGFLDEACAGDADLRSEVESLLAGQSEASGFLETPVSMAATARPFDAWMQDAAGSRVLAPGTRLGRYQITALVGAGGMGQIYEAFDPRLDRTVAIKIQRAGKLDGDQNVVVVERERSD